MRGTPTPLGDTKPTPNGYVMVKLGKGHPYAMSTGWQYQHRLNMMAKLNRPLGAGEIVKHADGDRSNNDIANLILISASPD